LGCVDEHDRIGSDAMAARREFRDDSLLSRPARAALAA